MENCQNFSLCLEKLPFGVQNYSNSSTRFWGKERGGKEREERREREISCWRTAATRPYLQLDNHRFFFLAMWPSTTNAYTFKSCFSFMCKFPGWNRCLYLEKPIFGNNWFSLCLSSRWSSTDEIRWGKESWNISLWLFLYFFPLQNVQGPAAYVHILWYCWLIII